MENGRNSLITFDRDEMVALQNWMLRNLALSGVSKNIFKNTAPANREIIDKLLSGTGTSLRVNIFIALVNRFGAPAGIDFPQDFALRYRLGCIRNKFLHASASPTHAHTACKQVVWDASPVNGLSVRFCETLLGYNEKLTLRRFMRLANVSNGQRGIEKLFTFVDLLIKSEVELRSQISAKKPGRDTKELSSGRSSPGIGHQMTQMVPDFEEYREENDPQIRDAILGEKSLLSSELKGIFLKFMKVQDLDNPGVAWRRLFIYVDAVLDKRERELD